MVLLHDWDGLTDYEMKRADMLVEQGFAVMAAEVFGIAELKSRAHFVNFLKKVLPSTQKE